MAALVVLLTGLWLALQRPDIPFATLESRYANAQSRYLDLPGGVRVHYRDQGLREGPTVVLVHGFSASLHAWEPWVARLGDRYRIITLDLPGHGLTRAPADFQASPAADADIVDQVANALGAREYIVGGNSMGGGVAWRDALDHPDHVRGLILVDSVGWPMHEGRGEGPLIFKLLGNPITRFLIRDIDNTALVREGLYKAYLDRRLVTEDLVRRYVELSRAPGHRQILLSGRPPPVDPKIFGRIKAPTLVMHGEKDALIPVDAGRKLAGAIPGAVLVTYPDVGHVPMEQIPDRSAADAAAFLARLNPAS